MSDLLTTIDGTNAMVVAQQHLLKRRLSRFFKRNLVISYNEWLNGNGFHLEDLLGQLNSANDTEILNLYRLLSIVGGLPATIMSMVIYVDQTNGSDDTGDGSKANPYKSLWFLPAMKSMRIDHSISICFLTDYTEGDLSIVLNHEFGPLGRFIFSGVGDAEVIESPLTVLATATDPTGLMREIQFTGAVAADPTSEFIQQLTGDASQVGHAAAIFHWAAADTIYILADAFPLLAGTDTMAVVRPPITLTLRDITLNGRNDTGYSATTYNEPHYSIINLRLATSHAGDASDAIVIEGNAAMMSFVQIDPPAAGNWRVNAPLNVQNLYNLYVAYAESNITNISDPGTMANQNIAGVSVQDTGSTYPLISKNHVRWVTSQGGLVMREGAIIEKCAVEIYSLCSDRPPACAGQINDCLALGTTSIGVGSGVQTKNARLEIAGLMVIGGDNIITIVGLSDIIVSRIDNTYSTITGYGVYFSGSGRVELQDDGAMLVGATNAIYFATVNPAIAAAIPAAFGWANDAQSSTVKRLSV